MKSGENPRPKGCLRKLRDVVAGIFKGDEPTTARQRDWIVEVTFPTAISH
jgi:hypothetical protein